MSVCEDVAAFSALAPAGPLLGLDPGSRTIGVAVCDPVRTVASALETIERTKFSKDAARLAEITDGRGITGAVVGLPLNMDGSAGPRVQSARAFAHNLTRVLSIPVLLWDERLSTVAAERALLEADTSRKRRAEVINHVAAAIILQGALDRMSMAARDDG